MKRRLLILFTFVCQIAIVVQAQNITVSSTQVTTGLSSSPILGGSVNQRILGVSINKSNGGANEITQLIISFNQDPNVVFSAARLFRDDSGTPTLVSNGVISAAPANKVTFDPISPTTYLTNFNGGSTSSVDRIFYVEVDVKTTVPSSTPAITASLTASSGVAISTVATRTGTVSGNAYAFSALEVNAVNGTGQVTTAKGGETSKVISSINLTSSGSQTLNSLVFDFDVDIASILSTSQFKLKDGATTIGTATYNAGTKKLTVSGLSSSLSSTALNLKLEADVLSSTASSSFKVSLANTGVTVASGLVSSFSTIDNTVAVTALATTAASGTGSVTTAVAGNTSVPILAVSVSSNGAQTLSALVFDFTTDISAVLSTAQFKLKDGATTLGTASYNAGTKKLTVTGISKALSSTAVNLVLEADVLANAAASAVTVSLPSSGVTVSTGTVASFTTVSNTVNTSLAQATAVSGTGALTSTTAGSTSVPIFSADFTSNGSQSLSALVFDFDVDIAAILSTTQFKLKDGSTTVGTASYNAGTKKLTVTGISKTLSSTALNLKVEADVLSSAAVSSFKISLPSGGVTVATGGAASFTTIQNTVSVTALSATAIAGTGAVTSTIAGATSVPIFSADFTSNGSQSLSSLVFDFDIDIAAILSTSQFKLKDGSTTVGTASYSAGTKKLTITGISKTLSSTALNLKVEADVLPGAAISSFKISLPSGGVTVATGNVTSFTTIENTVSVAALTATAASGTGAVTSTIAGATSVAVFSADFTSNGSQSLSSLVFDFDIDIAAILSTSQFKLKDGSTTVGTASYSAGTKKLTITGISKTLSSTALNLKLEADVLSSAALSSFKISLPSTGVTVSTGNVASFTTIENTVSVTALTATAAVGTGPVTTAIAGATSVPIFSADFTSNGSQSLSSLVFDFDIDISAILSTTQFKLKDGSTTVGTASYSAVTKKLTITGISKTLSSTALNLKIEANVLSTAAASSFKISLPSSGVTVATGSAASFTTIENTVSITALTATITAGTGASTTALGGATAVPILSVNAVSNGTQTLTTLAFVFDVDIATILNTSLLVLKDGATAVGSPTYNAGTKTLTVSGLSVAIATSKNLKLYADVLNTANAGSFTVSLANSGVTASPNQVAPFTTISNTVNISELTATFTAISAGPVVSGTTLTAATTTQALAGFSVVSNGSQVISAIDFNLSGLASQFSSINLYRSTTAGSVGTAIITGDADGNFDLTSVVVGNKTITTSTVYYYLVVNVATNVNGTTAAVTTNPTEANVTITGKKTTFTINKTYNFQASQTSAIAVTSDGQASPAFAYAQYTKSTAPTPAPSAPSLTTTNTESILKFSITDGDADALATTISSLTIDFTGISNIKGVALFDGTTQIAGTEKAIASTVVFSPISFAVPDGSVASSQSKTIDVRISFADNVTDNAIITASLTAAVADNAGSGLAAFSNIKSNNAKNKILVDADRLVFASAPTSVQVNTNFGLGVKAVDASNNVDVDRGQIVTLSSAGGPGSLSATGGEALFKNLSAGEITWSQLRINIAGTYTLTATYSIGGVTNGTTSIVIQSNGVIITKGQLPSSVVSNGGLCYNGNYQTLSDIIIEESDPADFKAGTNQTLTLALPAGYEFNTAVTTPPTLAGAEISSTGSPNLQYLSNSIVRFSYNISGTSVNGDKITIKGLQVKFTGASFSSGDLVRIGGSAVQVGNSDTDNKSLASLTSAASATAVDFTVEAFSGDPAVDPDKVNYSETENGVKLIGSLGLPATWQFSGNGVALISNGDYTFTPVSASQGSHTITFSVKEGVGQNCYVSKSKTFTVSSANIIQNLGTVYCRNGIPSNTMSVTLTQIAADFPAQVQADLVFEEFVYNQNNTPITILGTTFYIPNYVPIPAPNNKKFNPADAIYATPLADYGAVEVSYRVRRTTDNVILQSISRQRVTINEPPKVYMNISRTEFCSDDAPVDLTGIPTPSSNTNIDFFSATPTTNTGISSSGALWTFSPANVGASSSMQTRTITYTYKDPKTGCSATTPGVPVTVYPRPSIVPAARVTSGLALELCEGGTVGTFTVNPSGSESYVWYSDNPPTNQVGKGLVLPPPIDRNVVGTTKFYLTQVLNGCESRNTPLEVQITVNDTPDKPVSDFTREYCLNDAIPNADFNVIGSSVRWYNADRTVMLFPGSNPTASNLLLTTAAPSTTVLQITQTSLKGCESPATVATVIVKNLPTVSITSAATLSAICKTGDPIQLTTNFGGGDWAGTASSALSDLVPADPFRKVLNPINLNPGNYDLTYQYEDPSTLCKGTGQVNLTVLPTIVPSLSIGTSCDGSFVDIDNTSTTTSPLTATIVSYGWDFDDGYTVAPNSGSSIISGLDNNDGFSKGTYKTPSHKFKGGPNTYTVVYRMTTNQNCTVTAQQDVVVRTKPNTQFTWAGQCEGSSTIFTSTTSNVVDADITSYAWDFARQNNLTYNIVSGGKVAAVDYTAIGKDSVRLILTTKYNCTDTVSKPVYIVPSIPAIDNENSYAQDFNSGSGGWVSGGTKSSWAYGKPAATIINRDSSATGTGNAWVTNLVGFNNAGEQSWVLSPCFDLSASQKPVLSLDIWSNTPRGLDGAVLQYNDTDDIETESKWKVLGVVGGGVNWYDQNGITSKPGQQASTDAGWTGDESGNRYDAWKHAVYKLDALKGKPNVKFRIAFASTLGTQEGFAFDNFFVGERTRTVLLENFTNASSAATSAYNDFYNTFGNSNGEVVKLQYHTSFPAKDALNNANKAMNDARTAFYGITKAPTVRIDGSYESGVVATWAPTLYDNRILEPSPIKIIINSVAKDGDVVRINASIRNITTSVIASKGKHFFTAVVEKTITGSPWIGASGNTEFTYVAKDLLPSPAGIEITRNLAPGEVFDLPEIVWTKQYLIDETQGALAFFVQAVEGTAREVYQAVLYNTAAVPTLITGNEINASSQIQYYPVPANNVLNLVLPEVSRQSEALIVTDAFGKQVYTTTLSKGEQNISLRTDAWADGVYILQFKFNGVVIRKKIVVSHE